MLSQANKLNNCYFKTGLKSVNENHQGVKMSASHKGHFFLDILYVGLEEIKQFSMSEDSTFHLPSRTFNEMYSFDEPLGKFKFKFKRLNITELKRIFDSYASALKYNVFHSRNHISRWLFMERATKICCEDIETTWSWKKLARATNRS